MQVLYTSDLHLGHRSICKYRSKFSNAEDHDEYILNLMSKLSKRHILYILGDFLFDGPHFESYLKRISTFPCTIKLVMGNHDSTKLYTQTIAPNIQIQLPLFSHKNIWVSHCPIHPQELRNRAGNLHGHLHNSRVPDSRYFNVNLDVNNYDFVPQATILTTLKALNETN